MRIASRSLFLLAALVVAAPALAGGPLIVDNVTGRPWRYAQGQTVPVYTDLGNYSFQVDIWSDPPVEYVFDNAVGVAQVTRALAEWSSVPTSSFRASVAGDLASIGLP